jgi:acyl carrier protein
MHMDSSAAPSSKITSAIEPFVIKVWQEVLETSEIFPDSQFIECGGDSLTAMLCVSKLKAEFGVAPSVRDFLEETATPAAHAKLIEDQVA